MIKEFVIKDRKGRVLYAGPPLTYLPREGETFTIFDQREGTRQYQITTTVKKVHTWIVRPDDKDEIWECIYILCK